MAQLTVSLPLTDADRALLKGLLNGGTVLPDGEVVEPASPAEVSGEADAPETNELESLQARCTEVAKALLDDGQSVKVKAALDAAGAEQVRKLNTVEACETFLKVAA